MVKKYLCLLSLLLVCSLSYAGELDTVNESDCNDNVGQALLNECDEDKVGEGEEKKNIDVNVGVSQNIVQFTDHINIRGAVTKDVLGTDFDSGWAFWLILGNDKPLFDLRKKDE